jgi:hypothetical protein
VRPGWERGAHAGRAAQRPTADHETAHEANCALSSGGALAMAGRRFVTGLAAVCSNAQLAAATSSVVVQRSQLALLAAKKASMVRSSAS